MLHNIIENALQAMGRRGLMWIHTASSGDRSAERVTITLGNAGSSIAAEDIPQLFEAFFTKGKPGGTGLGLAIAKKIVTEHGGTIRCRSEPDLGVEFIITLPAAATLAESVSLLPSHSDKYRLEVPGSTSESRCDGTIVAVVEGDVFTAGAWEAELRKAVECVVFPTPGEFRRRFDDDASFRARLEFVVMDYHFDGEAENGAQVARDMRGKTEAAILCGSDAELAPTERAAFDVVCGKRARSVHELRRLLSRGSGLL